LERAKAHSLASAELYSKMNGTGRRFTHTLRGKMIGTMIARLHLFYMRC
jgi:hypothetical protein